MKSFGKKGQGPGELQWTLSIAFDSQDNVIVTDSDIRKNVVFDPQGNLIREMLFPKDVYAMYLIDNNRNIVYWRKYTSPEADHFNDHFGLSGPGMEGVRVLDSCRWPNPAKHGIRGNRLNRVFNWKASGDRIYVGNEDRGYEFRLNVQTCIFRKSLPIKPAVDIEGDALVRNGHLYWLQEEEFGYKTV